MTTNHTTKTITATTSELPLVQNYINHVIPPSERNEWKVNFIDHKVVEVRNNKK